MKSEPTTYDVTNQDHVTLRTDKGEIMGRSIYFAIGAVLASAVIAVATSYICKIIDSFSEAISDQELGRPVGGYDGTNEGAHLPSELKSGGVTQSGEPQNKKHDS